MPTANGWRRLLAALLMAVTVLAGAGRAAASTAPSTADPVDAVAGFASRLHAPICHSGGGAAPDDPAAPAPHDCCDDCALMALAVLPAPPSVADPFAPFAAAERGARPARPASLPRQRGPRQSRAPPGA